MARPRRSTEQSQTTNGGNTAMSTMFVDVEDTDLDAILAGARERGKYDIGLVEFLDSGKRGVEVSLAEGPFAGKKPVSVKTGFDGALGRLKEGKLKGTTEEHNALAEQVAITSRNDRVFLIRRDVASQAA